jgi:hypothetical protein
MTSFAEAYKGIEQNIYNAKIQFADAFAWALSAIDEEKEPEAFLKLKKVIQLLDITAPAKRDAKSITTFGNNLEKDIEREKSGQIGMIRFENKNYLFDPEYPLTDLGQIQEILSDAANVLEQLKTRFENENRTAA